MNNEKNVFVFSLENMRQLLEYFEENYIGK